MKAYAWITRTADGGYEGHLTTDSRLGGNHMRFFSEAEATEWLAEELAHRRAGKAARDEYKAKTAASVEPKNAEKSGWKYQVPGKNGHYLPLVILDAAGNVIRGGINREKMQRECDNQNGDGETAYRVADSRTGQVLGGSADVLKPLAEIAEVTATSAAYLRVLINRGKLDAKKVGRDWHTTENAVRRLKG